MSFIKTGILVNKISQKKLQKLSQSLESIDCPWKAEKKYYEEFFEQEIEWGGNVVEKLDINALDNKHLNVLGTIGGGNHFAEMQEINEIYDQQVI